MSDNTNHVRLNVSPKIIAPRSLFLQEGDDSAKTLLRLVTGHECVPMQGDTGEEDGVECGGLEYYDCEDGLGYRLAYRFEPLDGAWQVSKMTWYSVERFEAYDHKFDITRDRLAAALHDVAQANADNRHVREALAKVAREFAIRL